LKGGEHDAAESAVHHNWMAAGCIPAPGGFGSGLSGIPGRGAGSGAGRQQDHRDIPE